MRFAQTTHKPHHSGFVFRTVVRQMPPQVASMMHKANMNTNNCANQICKSERESTHFEVPSLVEK